MKRSTSSDHSADRLRHGRTHAALTGCTEPLSALREEKRTRIFDGWAKQSGFTRFGEQRQLRLTVVDHRVAPGVLVDEDFTGCVEARLHEAHDLADDQQLLRRRRSCARQRKAKIPEVVRREQGVPHSPAHRTECARTAERRVLKHFVTRGCLGGCGAAGSGLGDCDHVGIGIVARMATISDTGKFWRSDEPDKKMHGLLTFDEAGGRVELSGELGDIDSFEATNLQQYRRLIGQSQKEIYTLDGCRLRRRSTGSTNGVISNLELWVQTILVGAEFDAGEELAFDTSRCVRRFSNVGHRRIGLTKSATCESRRRGGTRS